MDEILQDIPCSYFNAEGISRLYSSNEGLLIFHHNIRSFSSNYDYLSILLEEINFTVDVIILSETWFSDDYVSEIDGYCGYHICRPSRGGGGVSIYVRSDMSSRFLSEYSSVSDHYEVCSVEITISNRNSEKLVILGIYRPPSGSIINFSNYLEVNLQNLSNKTIALTGDFNIDLLNDHLHQDFFNMLHSYSFFPFINIPTRVTESSAKCIDHIWLNRFNVVESGAIVSDISDHYPIFSLIEVVKSCRSFTKSFRDHCDSNLDRLFEDVNLLCIDYFNQTFDNDVDVKCEWFLNKLNYVYNRDCPKRVKTISIKRLSKPWIDVSLRRRANYKHHLFKQYKMNLIPFSTYNTYKNNLSKSLKNAKRRYYINKFKLCNKDIKTTWKTINSILSKPKSKVKNITLLDSRGEEVVNSNVISNMFCDHFATIADKLNSIIPQTQTDPLNYMTEQITESFNPPPATVNEVTKIIESLNNKPSNVNTIPIFIYKRIAIVIAPIICDIFNDSLAYGVFPEMLKIARISPLYKSKNNRSKENFRPISILPLTAKLMEKLMKTRALQFISEQNIYYDGQFGFRTGRNTTDAMLQLVDDCTTALDNRFYTVTVYLDFSKAYDTVNKSILLRKLHKLGFRENLHKYFDSYLTDRRVYVNVNGCNSTVRTINIGVPQGSVSSTWLFSLYINDMHRASKKLKFIHFADDTTVYLSGPNLRELCITVGEELTKIDEWLKANKLSLNIDKTCYMIHTHCNFNLNDCTIKIRDSPIKYVRSTKFLGLTIDDRFNYNDHTILLSKQLSRVKGILFRMSYFIPSEIVRKLYYALFYSRLTYGLAVWGGGGITNVGKFRKLNKSVTSIFCDNLPDYISKPLQYDHIYMYICLVVLHRYAVNQSFRYFNNKFNVLLPTHDYRTRFTDFVNYSSPHLSKTVSQNQFLFNSIKLWNALPDNIKTIVPQIEFKTVLKAYIHSL